MGWPQLIPRHTIPGQDLVSTITWASTITVHRRGPFTPSPNPPPRAQAPSTVCYTSACIKSRVRVWPYDRDGNLVSRQGATASLHKEERWGLD